MAIIDLHTDIASNALEATGKDIAKRYSLYEGIPKVPGLAAHNNIDIPRLKEGGVKLVFTSLFGIDEDSVRKLIESNIGEYNFKKLRGIKFGIRAAQEQMGYYLDTFNKNQGKISLIKSVKDYYNLVPSKKIGFLIHMEGIDYVDKDLKVVENFYNLGVRSLALTWRNSNKFGSGNNAKGGLTKLGKTLLRKIRDLGMIFDLAHANEETFWDVISEVDYPVVVSHTLCKKICKNSRNLSDEQIKAVANLGGILGMAAIPEYIGGDTIEDYVKHFEHIINLVGDDYICFGTDFDGLVDPEDKFVKGFTGPDGFPNIIAAFRKRGFSEKTTQKVCFQNAERVILRLLTK